MTNKDKALALINTFATGDTDVANEKKIKKMKKMKIYRSKENYNSKFVELKPLIFIHVHMK